MTLVQLDIFIRVGGLTTILLLAWLMARQARAIGTPAALFLPLSLCLTGFLIGNTPLASTRLSGLPATIANAASGFTVVFLWWFCLSCFDSRFRLRGGPLIVGLIWAAIAALDRGLFGEAVAALQLSPLLVAIGFGIVAHLIWRLVAERSGDLIQRRHDARIWVAIILGGILFVDLAADAAFGFEWRPLAFSMTQNAMIFAFGLWLAGKSVSVRPDTFFLDREAGRTAIDAASPEVANGPDEELVTRLAVLVDTQRIFLDPDISFATFADRMGAPERTVRQFINHHLGFDHFRTFLNHHRVAEARRLLSDRSRTEDKLIAIAFDSGFASLASFNRAFLSFEGRSPSAYRAAASAASHIDESRQDSVQKPTSEQRNAVF